MRHAVQPLCEGQSAGALTAPLLGPGTPRLDSPPFSTLVKPSGCSVVRRLSLSHEIVQLQVVDADQPPSAEAPRPPPSRAAGREPPPPVRLRVGLGAGTGGEGFLAVFIGPHRVRH